MTLHRSAHDFCEASADGVVSIGEIAGRVVLRLAGMKMRKRDHHGRAANASSRRARVMENGRVPERISAVISAATDRLG